MFKVTCCLHLINSTGEMIIQLTKPAKAPAAIPNIMFINFPITKGDLG